MFVTSHPSLQKMLPRRQHKLSVLIKGTAISHRRSARNWDGKSRHARRSSFLPKMKSSSQKLALRERMTLTVV